jgi:hypothetical protein
VVVLGSEIGDAMTINSIGFRHTSGDAVVFDQFTVYMGSAAGGSLGSNFDDNYSGGKTTVYDHTSASFAPSGGWITVPLDTPYFYSGTGNLIVEIAWPNGDMELYAGHWSTPGVNRTMTAFYGSPTGDAFEFCPNMLLSGTMSLAPMTFGGIKASFQ